jgi:hypothetical protein
MRIVKPDAEPRKYITADGAFKTYAYVSHDTIEISDTEWDEIYETYAYWPAMNDPIWKDGRPVNFAEYLRELISLAGEGR